MPNWAEALLPSMLAAGMVDPYVEKARSMLGRNLDGPYVMLNTREDFNRTYPRFDMSHPMPDKKQDNIEAFVDMRPPQRERVIRINPRGEPYRTKGFARLAAMLAHENEHVLGKPEREAYETTVKELERLGDPDHPYAVEVRRRLKDWEKR